jgi:HD-like signal output (HDOD) protein
VRCATARSRNRRLPPLAFCTAAPRTARAGWARSHPTGDASCYSKLHIAVSRETADVQELAELLATDPVMAAKVLQMANSAFFRLARPTVNIDQAVSYLGVPAIGSMVTSPSIFSPWPDRGPSTLVNFEELQSHAHVAATAAQALATPASLGDEALLAGLLHNIGYWLLAHECPERLANAVEAAVAERIPLSRPRRAYSGLHMHRSARTSSVSGGCRSRSSKRWPITTRPTAYRN